MHHLTAFQRDCLYVIAGLGDPSGTAILNELDDYYENENHHGRLYPSLDHLFSVNTLSNIWHEKPVLRACRG